jgi:hypothetical protein
MSVSELLELLELWEQIEQEHTQGTLYADICYKHIYKIKKQIKEIENNEK